MNYNGAVTACNSLGGILFEPRNLNVFTSINNWAKQLGITLQYYIGLYGAVSGLGAGMEIIYQSDNSQVGLNTAPAGTVFFDFTMYAPWCPMHPSMLICPSFGFTGCCVSVDFLNDCWTTIDCSSAAKY